MLTTQFEDVKMSEDESFDSFYGRLNEIVIAKLNLMGSRLAKENSHPLRMTKETSRRRMQKTHYHPKRLFAMNAMVMCI